MKSIGIVGSEAAKFNMDTEFLARGAIRTLIAPYDRVVSGKCHLGGIDIWAVEEALAMGKIVQEYPAHTHRWQGHYRNGEWRDGYKDRNMKIALDVEKCVCITVRELPANYAGMKFAGCYHCDKSTPLHVKSGGCWTMIQSGRRGKETQLVIIHSDRIEYVHA